MKTIPFDDFSPPFSVACATTVTAPGEAPVSDLVATPPLAADAPEPLTLPEPPDFVKLTEAVLSAPDATTLPFASRIVAVNGRDAPTVRSAFEPDSEMAAAEPATMLNALAFVGALNDGALDALSV